MNRPGVALMSASHVVDDIYQGCVPALLPFLVAERHYTYAAVSGLTLAARCCPRSRSRRSAGGPIAGRAGG